MSTKEKHQYIDQLGKIDSDIFRSDILNDAISARLPVGDILALFFNKEEFTKEEMAEFALGVTTTGLVLEAAIILYHALGIFTPEQAKEHKVLENYFGFSEDDLRLWQISWIIDAAMNWPPGTSLAKSIPEA